MNRFFQLLICAAAVVASIFCAPQYSTAGMFDVSEDKEIRIGEEAARMLVDEYGVVKSKAEVDRLIGITDYLIKASGRPGLEYHFYIIDTEFINAFALPGGYIFITRGLMDFVDDDDELASVVAHELVHVSNRHGVVMYKKNLKQMVMNFIILALTRDPKAIVASDMYQQSRMDIFGRSAEVEADQIGIQYMMEAGYNPHAMLKFMDKMKREGTHRPNLFEDYFDFHPPMEERKEIINAEYEKLGIGRASIDNSSIEERIIVHEDCTEEGICTSTLYGGDMEIMRIGDNGGLKTTYIRAKAISIAINDLLDKEIRMYEVKKKKEGKYWSLWARNIMIVKVLPGDVEGNSVESDDALADKWMENIKIFLWKDFIKEDI